MQPIHELTRAARACLIYLLCFAAQDENGNRVYTTTELMKAIGVNRTNTTTALTNLVKNGWLEFVTDTRHSKTKHYEATVKLLCERREKPATYLDYGIAKRGVA